MQGVFVVDRYLFTGINIMQCEENELTIERASEGVGCAAVIDIVRAITAAAAINAPAMIDTANTQDTAPRSAFRLPI